MGKYKLIEDGYLLCIGIGDRGTPIMDEEYETILAVILTKPEDTEETYFRLTENLEYVECERPPIPEPEPTPEEALAILLGEEGSEE